MGAGSSPLSGTFSLVYPGQTFQEAAETGPISVHASAGSLASELANLDSLTMDDIRVSRSSPSAEGELAWTVTFVSGWGDVPMMQAVLDSVTGTGAAVRVTTVANGVAPVKGSVSLVAFGVRGKVRTVNDVSNKLHALGSESTARSAVARICFNVLRRCQRNSVFPRVPYGRNYKKLGKLSTLAADSIVQQT